MTVFMKLFTKSIGVVPGPADCVTIANCENQGIQFTEGYLSTIRALMLAGF